MLVLMSLGAAESGCQNVWMLTKTHVKWMLSILVWSIFSSLHHNILKQLVIFDETELYHNEPEKKQIHKVAAHGFYRSAKIENPMIDYLQQFMQNTFITCHANKLCVHGLGGGGTAKEATEKCFLSLGQCIWSHGWQDDGGFEEFECREHLPGLVLFDYFLLPNFKNMYLKKINK